MKLGIHDLQTKLNKSVKQLFQIQNRRLWQPSKYDGEAAKQEVSPFLSYPLTYHNQTRYIDSWHHPGNTKEMVTFDLWGALCLNWSLHMCGFQTYFQCLVILSDLPIQILNDNSRKHQNFGAILKVVKITSYIFTGHKFCPIFFMWRK